MRTIVIAAGSGTRWGNYLGTEKHLVPVLGERLLDRTARLFAEFSEVHVVGLDERYETPYSTLHVLSDVWPTGTDADKFLSSEHLWAKDDTTIVAYGDVFFSDAARGQIETVAGLGVWRLVSRLSESKFTGTPHGECFAQILPVGEQERHREMLYRVADLRLSGRLRRCGGWEHYRLMAGGDPKVHADYGVRLEVDDWTEDFDYPQDFDSWVGNRTAAGLPV